MLRVSAVDLGTSGFDTSFGYGRVDASAAVTHGPPLEALILGPSARPIPVADPVDVQGRVQGPDLAGWSLAYGVGTLPSAWTSIASSTTPVAGGRLAEWSITALPDGEYTLRLVARVVAARGTKDRQRVLIDRVSISSPSPSRISLFRSGDTVTLRGTAALGGFQSYSLKLMRTNGEEVGASGLAAANSGASPGHRRRARDLGVPDAQRFSIEMTVVSSIQTWKSRRRSDAPPGMAEAARPDRDRLPESGSLETPRRGGRQPRRQGRPARGLRFEREDLRPHGRLPPGGRKRSIRRGGGFDNVQWGPAVGDVNGDGAGGRCGNELRSGVRVVRRRDPASPDGPGTCSAPASPTWLWPTSMGTASTRSS